MKIISQLFGFVSFLQSILLMLFMLENINTLDSIDYTININGTYETFEFNFYAMIGIIIALYLIVIVASLSIFNSGLNSEGTIAVSRYVAMFSLFAVLSVGSSYYILLLGNLGIIIDIIFLLIYVVYMMYRTDSSVMIMENGD